MEKSSDGVGTDLEESGLGAYNSLGSGKRYNAPLKRIFLSVSEEQPKMENNIILKLAIKAMNNEKSLKGSFHPISCLISYPYSL